MNPRTKIAAWLFALASLAPAVSAQALREVVVDVRLQSQALGTELTGAAVVAALAEKLREQARFQFGYLNWVPAGTTTASEAPRLVLRIFDGPTPECGTPAVRFRISTEVRGTESWRKLERDLSDPCDIGVTDWTADELVDRIAREVESNFDEPRTLDEIQGSLLSKVPLAERLEPDATGQRLYLPLTGLLAGEGSELVAKFGDQNDRFLAMTPIEVRDGRTRVKLVQFSCDSIEFAADAAPADWSPLLPSLLERCRDPRVYMKTYRPDRAAETTTSGLRTRLDDEGGVNP